MWDRDSEGFGRDVIHADEGVFGAMAGERERRYPATTRLIGAGLAVDDFYRLFAIEIGHPNLTGADERHAAVF